MGLFDKGKPKAKGKSAEAKAKEAKAGREAEKPKKAAFAARNPTAAIVRSADDNAMREKARRLAKATHTEESEKPAEVIHSSQLDERLRRSDLEATPEDRRNKAILDSLVVLALLLLVTVVVGKVGIGFSIGIDVQTYLLAAATFTLAGCSYLFNMIRWRALRGALGAKVLQKAKAELVLTTVSVAALFTVVAMGIVELGALLVFVGAIPVGEAGAQFAGNFVLFQTIMLLVYLGAVVARENNVTSFKPKPRAVTVAKWLTPVALFFVFLGAVIASGILPAGSIEPHQGVYIVTLGVLLEFIAMRIRLTLPSLWSLFEAAIGQTKKANEEVKDELRKRALRTYVTGSVFVALSMAFAGAVATGTIGLDNGRLTTALVVFYVGAALVLLGIIAVRVIQGRHLEHKPVTDGDDELSRLVRQRKRSPAEIFRMAVYGVTGVVAAGALLVAILIGMGKIALHEKYATDFFIVAVMFGAGPFGYFNNRETKRILAIDEKFPDFLRDLAESARAGMTLPRALVSAAGGTYGALTDDIKTMASQVEWGVEFADALARFAKRTRTPLIDRTVNLIVEAQRAGGSVVEILTAASEDAREIKQIISERNTQMSMYTVVIYISYFVFITVVLVLSAQFIPAFKAAVGGEGGASGQQVGGLQFRDFDPEDFNTIFFHAALVQAIGGGLVGGVLSKGSAVAGFMHIGIMMAVAWLSFRVVVGLL